MNTMTDTQNHPLVFEHRKAGTVAADEKKNDRLTLQDAKLHPDDREGI